MSNTETYQPTGKYKNYSLPNSKPFKSHALYEEKVWTVQEHIFKNLKKVAELLEGLYPKLTDDVGGNIKEVIERNLEILSHDLDLMHNSFRKNPYTFNTSQLKVNQHRITEMKDVCATLQTIRSYEDESKQLGHIKHALTQLEHLIQPTRFEKDLEEARIKSKPKTAPVKAKTKTKKKPTVTPKVKKAVSKKAKPKVKSVKPVKTAAKQQKTSEGPTRRPKSPTKKTTKPKAKPKVTAAPKKALKAKSKPKVKSAAKRTTKSVVKTKKPLAVKSKPKTKSVAARKKKSSSRST